MATEQNKAAIVRDVDGIMAVEDFPKTEKMRALDAAFIEGRMSLEDQLAFTLLDARIVSARSVLDAIGELDPRHSGIAYTLAAQETQMRNMAQNVGGDVAKFWAT